LKKQVETRLQGDFGPPPPYSYLIIKILFKW